jgi:hypothetical protein
MPASAQEVKLEELRGATIAVAIVRSQRWQRGETEVAERFEDAIEYTFAPNDLVRVAWTRTTVGGPWGTMYRNFSSASETVKPRVKGQYEAKIGNVRKITAGHAVLVYLNGTLTAMQTGSKGGRKLEIKFARNTDGLTCTARRLWMRETGADSIVGVGLRNKAPFVLVKERQISQTCSVTKP